jgi:hypothetical protein
MFHKDATSSFKQVSQANLNHLSRATKRVRARCGEIEPDIDCTRISRRTRFSNHSKSPDWIQDGPGCSVLRWIAGRHAGIPEFNPPYVLA